MPAPERCQLCNKKVKTMGFVCKCEHVFCMTHRLPADHGCDFDYKAEGASRLREQNPRIEPKKIDRLS